MAECLSYALANTCIRKQELLLHLATCSCYFTARPSELLRNGSHTDYTWWYWLLFSIMHTHISWMSIWLGRWDKCLNLFGPAHNAIISHIRRNLIATPKSCPAGLHTLIAEAMPAGRRAYTHTQASASRLSSRLCRSIRWKAYHESGPKRPY